jgi:D-inositol-3-phosphate glycosyltransferase
VVCELGHLEMERRGEARKVGVTQRLANPTRLEIGLLTGGDDKPYALGLTGALREQGIALDFIGSDLLDDPAVRNTPGIRFMNLRGDTTQKAGFLAKLRRILLYYARLVHYALTARPRIFHILWNNKFEFIDRVILMGLYRACGRKVVMTVHNVNAARRDGRDSPLNRLTLRCQYFLCCHLFAHTERMKAELRDEFGVPETKISVIPFGINNTLPRTTLTSLEAKKRLGASPHQPTILFFGQIAPYKGLEYLVQAMAELQRRSSAPKLIVAGKIKRGSEDYWKQIEDQITTDRLGDKILKKIQFIPDSEVEIYFKAADAIVMPYVQIFQSGVPFLAFNFGLPVIATDVGSLREDIVSGKTGFLSRPQDPLDLAEKIREYLASDLYRHLEAQRENIVEFANEKYSWSTVGKITRRAYEVLLKSAKD